MKTAFDEIRKIAFRALNGAGAPPGIDDDGGWACAWLEAAGYPGLAMLAELLDEAEPADLGRGIDNISAGEMDADGCSSITLAGLIVEYAAAQANPVVVKRVRHAPYLVAHAARLSAQDTILNIDPVGEELSDVTIRPAGDGYTDQQARVNKAIQDGLEVNSDAFERVYAYSRAVLLPQSETSLLSGAGAGLTDND